MIIELQWQKRSHQHGGRPNVAETCYIQATVHSTPYSITHVSTAHSQRPVSHLEPIETSNRNLSDSWILVHNEPVPGGDENQWQAIKTV
jgi:hypothetical protein